MGKTRVHELAKAVGLSSKELVDVLAGMGIEANSHSATLEDSDVDRVRVALAGQRRKAKAKTGEKKVVRKVVRPAGEAAGEAAGAVAGGKVIKRRVVKRVVGPKASASAAPEAPAAPAKSGGAKEAKASDDTSSRIPTPPVRPVTRKPAPKPPRSADKAPAAKEAAAETAAARPSEAPKREEAKKSAPPDKPAAKAAPKAPGKKPAKQGARTADKGPGRVAREEGATKSAPPAREAASPVRQPVAEVPAEAPAASPPAEAAPPPAPEAPAAAPARGGGAPSRGPGGRKGRRGPEPVEVREGAAAATDAAQASPFVRMPTVTEVTVRRGVTVQEIAGLMGVATTDVIKALMELGEMKAATASLADSEVELLGDHFRIATKVVSPESERQAEEAAIAEAQAIEDEGSLALRAPVVTVMGHVDHGKTKLLDRIRTADVVATEAGGITQHIGAYRVRRGDKWVTFIDTPGHEAFTAMRARGASVTDVAVLVIAADDGVMPQTVEAISHIRAAGVPMVVAINKIDKPEADPQRVRTQLTEQNVIVEDFGGDVPAVEVSAVAGTGVDELLDIIGLVAEIAELRANPAAAATGVCVEAHVDVGRGPVATILVKRGTLRRGDAFVSGLCSGKVRAMLDEHGRQVDEVGPSVPVQVLGFDTVPEPGDEFRVVADERNAREIADSRRQAERQADQMVSAPVARLEDLFAQLEEEGRASLALIVKADVQGSLEALIGAIRKIENPEVDVQIVHSAVGGVTENDVSLALASHAAIVAFNVRPDRKARELARRDGVEIRAYDVIYQAVEEIDAAMRGLLAPIFEEVVTGSAEVRALFKVPRIGVVAGCYVQEGEITRNSKARLIRDGVVVYTGQVSSLKRFKDDVRQVASGFECGIGLEGFNDLKEGDVIETFEEREVAR